MPPTPEFSILVARASTVEAGGVLDLLAALRGQEGNPSYEVVVADRLSDHVTGRIEREFTEAVVIRAPARTSIPALRAVALAHARGDLVAVIGDSCVPDPDWLSAFRRSFATAPQDVVAVGGCVVNGSGTSPLARATFLCEYLPFMPPLTVRDGIGTAVDGAMDPLSYVLPFIWTRLGMKIGNTINDRSLNLDLYQGFEETTVDLYSAVRNGYLQRRDNMIRGPAPY